MINEAMIFSAGLGKRMLPLTKAMPKPLVKINNNSLLKNNIEKLIQSDFKNIVVNAFNFPEQIISETSEFPYVQVLIEEERLETGGGLLNAIKKKYFKKKSPIVLLNGDIFWYNKDYNSIDKIKSLWNPNKMDILICLKKKKDFLGYDGDGDFELKKSDYLYHLLEKKKLASYAFTGLQIIKQEIFKDIKKKSFSIREQIFESLKNEKLFGYVDTNPWFHIGTLDDLKKFKKES